MSARGRRSRTPRLPAALQLNLPLLQKPAGVVPDDQQRELILVEILIGAARVDPRREAMMNPKLTPDRLRRQQLYTFVNPRLANQVVCKIRICILDATSSVR
jgi:hypothetical protein